MTLDELHTRIRENPEALEFATAGFDELCAQWINEHAPFIEVREMRLSQLGILALFPDNPEHGAAVIDAMIAASAGSRALQIALGFTAANSTVHPDVGNTATRNMLDSLATAGALAAEDVAVLKGAAEFVRPVAHSEVSAVWNDATRGYRPGGKIPRRSSSSVGASV